MSMQKLTAFVNGEILSVDADNHISKYESMLVNGRSIEFLGASDRLESLISGITAEVVDLNGKSIVPGFTDSHLHASSMTELLFAADMLIDQPGTMFSRDEAISKYRQILIDYLKKNNQFNSAPLIRGAGWDPGVFMGTAKGYPTAADLDGICDDVPIILHSYDHHYIWVNKKALEMSRITKDDPDPRNGRVWRNKYGNPIGVFQENTAVDMFMNRIPCSDYTVEQYKAGIRAFQDTFGSPLGITMIFDAYNSSNGMRAYKELAENEELNLRVKTCFYADPAKPESQFDKFIEQKNVYHINDIFNVDTVKFFMDGTGLSFCMSDPFEKEWLQEVGMPEDYRGYPQWTQAEINRIFKKLDSAGFQIHVHCMGDEATKMTLDAFEYISSGNPVRHRHTIAHLMQVREEDLVRIAKLGVVSAMQPMWAQRASLAETMSNKSLGWERVLNEYRIGSIIKEGGIVSFGTDFPVTIPPDPIKGIQVAMSRSVTSVQPDYEQFKGTRLGPENDPSRDCISLSEAIGAYCYGGAYQCHMEKITGSLLEGMSADFAILSGCLTSTPENSIEHLKVEKTFFKGAEVWSL